MTSPESFRTIAEKNVEYEFPVDHAANFNKLMTIWRTQCQSVNRRLVGEILTEENSEDHQKVLKALPQSIRNDLEDCEFEIRKLIFKQLYYSQNSFELSYEYPCNSTDQIAFVFYPVRLDEESVDSRHGHIPMPYMFKCVVLSDNSLRFNLSVISTCDDDSCKWLSDVAFPIIVKWLERIDPKKEIKPSNRLISIENYSKRYRQMKEEHGKSIANKWTEKTNPEKFVFEDCGIASYLIETWERLNLKPKCFVDMGCGNGLLVHLLNLENYKGVGLDIRKRRIWDTMFAKSDLREVSIDPTAENTGLPDESDFLIGNHSDELTPWIPILAARKKCPFILIPCCPFDFHGKYTSRVGDGGSGYNCFLNFVKEACSTLGYVVEEDRLSIPSTRRLCFVCMIPPGGLVDDLEETIAFLTKHRPGSQPKPFLARSKLSESRNCTQIASSDKIRLTSMFFNYLLEGCNDRVGGWRCGKKIPLSEIIKIVSNQDKLLMKQQDGGVQTFLKNQYQVFQVIKGTVMIRDWRTMNKKPSQNAKTTRCWMLENHPDGCPYGEDCYFKHD